MKRPLLSKPLFSFVISFLLILSSGFAQELKRTHDDAPQKGHNLYKQSKLYDSKKGPVGAKPKAIGDRALDRLAYEFRLLQDPVSKRIPNDILTKESEFSDKIAPTKK